MAYSYPSLTFGSELPKLPTVAGDMARWGTSVSPNAALPTIGTINSSFATNQNTDIPETPEFNYQAGKGFLGLYGPDGNFSWANAGSLTKALGGLGQVWAAFQANKLAKDSLNFQKESYQTNLANQIASYNMALEDRAYARAAQNNAPQNTAQSYISQHKLG